jgi:hypothetical protein
MHAASVAAFKDDIKEANEALMSLYNIKNVVSWFKTTYPAFNDQKVALTKRGYSWNDKLKTDFMEDLRKLPSQDDLFAIIEAIQKARLHNLEDELNSTWFCNNSTEKDLWDLQTLVGWFKTNYPGNKKQEIALKNQGELSSNVALPENFMDDLRKIASQDELFATIEAIQKLHVYDAAHWFTAIGRTNWITTPLNDQLEIIKDQWNSETYSNYQCDSTSFFSGVLGQSLWENQVHGVLWSWNITTRGMLPESLIKELEGMPYMKKAIIGAYQEYLTPTEVGWKIALVANWIAAVCMFLSWVCSLLIVYKKPSFLSTKRSCWILVLTVAFFPTIAFILLGLTIPAYICKFDLYLKKKKDIFVAGFLPSILSFIFFAIGASRLNEYEIKTDVKQE